MTHHSSLDWVPAPLRGSVNTTLTTNSILIGLSGILCVNVLKGKKKKKKGTNAEQGCFITFKLPEAPGPHVFLIIQADAYCDLGVWEVTAST